MPIEIIKLPTLLCSVKHLKYKVVVDRHTVRLLNSPFANIILCNFLENTEVVNDMLFLLSNSQVIQQYVMITM